MEHFREGGQLQDHGGLCERTPKKPECLVPRRVIGDGDCLGNLAFLAESQTVYMERLRERGSCKIMEDFVSERPKSLNA